MAVTGGGAGGVGTVTAVGAEIACFPVFGVLILLLDALAVLKAVLIPKNMPIKTVSMVLCMVFFRLPWAKVFRNQVRK